MDLERSLGASVEVYKMTLFFSGIILWSLLLIIYIIPFEGMMTCLGSLVLGGYSFIWYLAIKWDAQKGENNVQRL